MERVRPLTDLAGLAAHACSPAESVADADAFYRLWTRKEAVVKGSGVGVATDLRRVEVRPDRATALVGHRGAEGGPDTWAVRDLPAGPGHRAAVAVAVVRR